MGFKRYFLEKKEWTQQKLIFVTSFLSRLYGLGGAYMFIVYISSQTNENLLFVPYFSQQPKSLAIFAFLVMLYSAAIEKIKNLYISTHNKKWLWIFLSLTWLPVFVILAVFVVESIRVNIG